jgi:hypothetical protein
VCSAEVVGDHESKHLHHVHPTISGTHPSPSVSPLPGGYQCIELHHSLTFPASSLVHHKFLPHFHGTAVFLSSFDLGVSCFVKFFSIRFAEVRTLDKLIFDGLGEWCALQE